MTTSRTEAAAREARATALHADGASTTEIAAALGVSARTVRRILVRTGADAPMPHTPVDRERLALLAAEGMPANWIAEDLGCARGTALELSTRVEGHAEAAREWRRVWASIRHNETLRALHAEFTPKRRLTPP